MDIRDTIQWRDRLIVRCVGDRDGMVYLQSILRILYPWNARQPHCNPMIGHTLIDAVQCLCNALDADSGLYWVL